MSDHSMSFEKKGIRCQLIPRAGRNTYVGFCARLGTPWTDFVPLQWSVPNPSRRYFRLAPGEAVGRFKTGSSRRREEEKKKDGKTGRDRRPQRREGEEERSLKLPRSQEDFGGVWERREASRSLEFAGRVWLTTFALVGGRGREIFLPLGARTVETAGEKRKE